MRVVVNRRIVYAYVCCFSLNDPRAFVVIARTLLPSVIVVMTITTSVLVECLPTTYYRSSQFKPSRIDRYPGLENVRDVVGA